MKIIQSHYILLIIFTLSQTVSYSQEANSFFEYEGELINCTDSLGIRVGPWIIFDADSLKYKEIIYSEGGKINSSKLVLESGCLRDSLFNFLISHGDYDKKAKTENTLLIINDISSFEEFNNRDFGVFKFGTLTSHSYFHLLLKDKEDFIIVDMKQPYENVALLLLEYFHKNKNYSKAETLSYLKGAIELYKNNQGVVPWEVDK